MRTATCSNRPAITPGHEAAVRDLLEKYDLGHGPNETMMAVVNPPDGDGTGDPAKLVINGRAEFHGTKRSVVAEWVDERFDPDDDTERDRLIDDYVLEFEGQHTEEFLTAVAQHLEDPLHIQTISHEKCRYPFGAYEWVATPEGEVRCNRLGDMPTPPQENAAPADSSSVAE